MKNFIKSNYNIYPKKIFKKDNQYFFFSGNDKILIIKTNNIDLSKIDLSNHLYNIGIPISTFLINNNGEYYCKKDNQYILLLKYNNICDNQIYLKDINTYDIKIQKINNFDIIKYWEDTIDSIELKLNEYNKEFPILQQSINYFIGLSENAIELLNNIKYNSDSLGHKLNIDNYNRENYSNPFNIIKTNKMYDIAMYFKYQFYNNNINYDELYSVLKQNLNNINDIVFFYSNMLFQENYFNCVINIMNNKGEEKELNKYIDNINKYRELLKYIKSILHNITYIKDIEWIDS